MRFRPCGFRLRSAFMNGFLRFFVALTLLGCDVSLPEDRILCAEEGPECPDDWECEPSTNLCRPPDYVGEDAGPEEDAGPIGDSNPGDVNLEDAGPSPDACVTEPSTAFTLPFAGSDDDSINGIVAIDDGYVVVGTSRSDETFFGCGSTSSSSGLNSAFVARLSLEGAVVWQRRFASSGGTVNAVDLAVENGGRILVAGTFDGVISFEEGVERSAVGDTDVFLMALAMNGNVLWARAAGGPGLDAVTQLAVVDRAGSSQVCVAGGFVGELVFGDLTLRETIEGANTEGFVFCADVAMGDPSWGDVQGGPGSQFSLGITAERSRLYIASSQVTGSTTSDVAFLRYDCTSVEFSCSRRTELFRHEVNHRQAGYQIVPRGDEVLILGRFANDFALEPQISPIDAAGGATASFYAALIRAGVSEPEVVWATEFGVNPSRPAEVRPRRMVVIGNRVHIVGDFGGSYAPGAMTLEYPYDPAETPRRLDGFHAVLNADTGEWEQASALGTGGFIQSVTANTSGDILLVGSARGDVFGNTNQGGEDGFIHVVRP